MTNSCFLFIVLALATFRVSRLIALDSLTEPVREWLRVKGSLEQIRHTPQGEERRVLFVGLWGWIFRLVTCIWCVSIWVSAAIVVLMRFGGGWFEYIAFALALSSIAGITSERL